MMQFQEVVEAQGHLIDSHIMEQIMDKVVEYNGRFEVEEFNIGRTNDDPTYLRMKIEAPSAQEMDHLLSHLVGLGCTPVNSGEAQLSDVERDCCAPFDFYSTTNHKTLIRHGNQWLEVRNQRMDAAVVVRDNTAVCRRLRDIKAGDQVVVGMRGIRVVPEAKERDRHSFSFMSNEISSERQVETAVRQTAALIRRVQEQGLKVVVVAGPVCVHTGGARGLSTLIRNGFVQVLLSGNALGVHDVESALLGTSLGIRMADGRQEEHGHRNHMRAINAIYHCGSIAGAVEQGRLQSGILYESKTTSPSSWPAASVTMARSPTPLPI
jgi:lysine-ketoglutarate reductase/saccharopine dehydrogenase-like protein (TIGR00300 family)